MAESRIESGIQTEKLVYLHPSQIKIVEGRNKRFDPGDLEELANSIEQNGIVNPIKVRLGSGNPELIDGHRRHAAVSKIVEKYQNGKIPKVQNREITSIPCRVVSLENESDIIFHMLVSNDSKPFLPLEEATMLKDLKDAHNLTAEQIAKKIGKSISHVNDRLALLGASEKVKEAVQTGDLKPSEAVTIVRKSHGNHETQEKLVERVKEEGSSVIQKELLKGRFKKEQWEEAEKVFDEFFAATMAPDTFIRKNDIRPTQVSKILEVIMGDPNLEVAYQLGRVAGIGTVTHMEPLEILKRIHQRLNNSDGDFE